VQEEREKE
jgi:hypothetical protein